MKIVVRIERLVLDGIANEPGHRARLCAALEQELARLVGAPGAFDASDARGWRAGATPTLRAPGIRPVRGETPETTGRRIAGALHAGIRGRR